MQGYAKMRFPPQYLEVLGDFIRRRLRLLEQAGRAASVTLPAWLSSRAACEFIDGAQMRTLLELCLLLAEPDRPASVQVLEHFPLTGHGALGMVAMTSPDLNAALDAALRFYPLVMPAYDIVREDSVAAVHLIIRPKVDFGPVGVFLTEMILGSINGIRRFLHQDVAMLEMHFAHANAFAVEAYQGFFGTARLLFGQPVTRLVIPKSSLSLSIATGNRSTQQQLEHQLLRQLYQLRQTQSLSAQLKHRIRDRLHSGATLTAEALAADLAVSGRTLNRRLAEEGVTFKDILGQERIDYAEFLLLGSQQPVARIAHAAGFGNESSFARAFKKLKGKTPTELRRLYEGSS